MLAHILYSSVESSPSLSLWLGMWFDVRRIDDGGHVGGVHDG